MGFLQVLRLKRGKADLSAALRDDNQKQKPQGKKSDREGGGGGTSLALQDRFRPREIDNCYFVPPYSQIELDGPSIFSSNGPPIDA
jgi:hypothetical protein